MYRKVMIGCILVMALLILVSCGNDDYVCVQSHEEPYLQPIMGYNAACKCSTVMFFIPSSHTICDVRVLKTPTPVPTPMKGAFD